MKNLSRIIEFAKSKTKTDELNPHLKITSKLDIVRVKTGRWEMPDNTKNGTKAFRIKTQYTDKKSGDIVFNFTQYISESSANTNDLSSVSSFLLANYKKVDVIQSVGTYQPDTKNNYETKTSSNAILVS